MIRADLTFEIPPGRIASSTSSTGRIADLPPTPASARAGAGRRRRGCGRWSTARGPSGSARRAGRRAGRSAGPRRPRAAVRAARSTRARAGGDQPAGEDRDRGGRRHTTTVSERLRLYILGRWGGSANTPASLDGLPVFWRSAPPRRGGAWGAVTLYLHGVPTNSDDWLAFLRAGGGLPHDLPGFGRSGKPRLARPTRSPEYADFIERFLDQPGDRAREPGRPRLGRRSAWPSHSDARSGSSASRSSTRSRFCPATAGTALARIWRTPGSASSRWGVTYRPVLRLLSREATRRPDRCRRSGSTACSPPSTAAPRRAILRLYRSSPPAWLAAAGEGLAELAVPALVAWGMRDPYIPARFARDYARRAPRRRAARSSPTPVTGPGSTGPTLIDRVAGFLSAG